MFCFFIIIKKPFEQFSSDCTHRYLLLCHRPSAPSIYPWRVCHHSPIPLRGQQQTVPARGGVRQPAGCMQFSWSVSLWAGSETRLNSLWLSALFMSVCFHLLQCLLSLFKSFHTFIFLNVTLQILFKCFQPYYSFKKIIVYALGEALWRNLAYKSCNQMNFGPWSMQLYDMSGKLLKAEFLDMLCKSLKKFQ